MVAENGRIWDSTLDQGSNHFKERSLTIVYVMVQLIACEDHEIRLLEVQNGAQERHGERIGHVGRQRLPMGIHRVATLANASHHVSV